jgi:eukaryotic-like serine/threonine-protein kinase
MAGTIAAPGVRLPCPTCGYLADPGVGPVNFCPKCGQDLRPGAGERTRVNALIGLVVADRYRLIEHLGEGGMGSVYKAEHIRMGKALAVKILRGDFARDPSAVERFRAEARIVSRLSHPNTIAVFDFGEIEALGGFYLAMEYVPGRDLARVLRDEGRLAAPRAADIGEQILGSLAEAHEAGIVHRDMKPGNVMLMQTRPGEDFAKVLDFGIAKLRDEGAASQTSAGAIVGTPNYLSPEQARGEPLDARADLYAVGCLLYELLSGQPPFAGRSPVAVVNAHLHEQPPPLGEAVPGLSHRFVDLVHKALSKRREDRFESADAMREAILALGEPTSSRSLSLVPQVTGELKIAKREDFQEFERQLRSLRRSRVLAPAWLVLVALLVGGLAWRWNDVFALLQARAPALAARVPEGLRPADRYDGEEHEPNDLPSLANRLPLPPGPDGAPGEGTVQVRGTVGARLGPTSGDVDVYRIEVPPHRGPRNLAVSWHAEGSPGGIRGLDVVLTLNRAPDEGAESSSARLVASADRGGPGQPEQLTAPVEPGTYFLSVRERHEQESGPVEKPTDRYLLEARLVAPRPGEEVEPNDSPESIGLRGQRYPDWLAVAGRNPLLEARTLGGELSPGDLDTFSVPVELRPAVVVVAPEPGLAVSVKAWSPDAADLEPGGSDRVRLELVGTGGPGDTIIALLKTPPAASPALVQLRAEDGQGRYAVVALGAGAASGSWALQQVQALADAGKLVPALELAAAVARHLPRSPARSELLALAGRLAQAAAPGLRPADLPRFDRTARLLGTAPFEDGGGELRYRGAFEQRVEGRGPVAEEAALRALRLADPCTPALIAERVEAYVGRFPASHHLSEVRLWRARALELELAASGYRDAELRRQTTAAWEKLGRGPGAAEAREALARLRAKAPPHPAPGLPAVCPDPGAD